MKNKFILLALSLFSACTPSYAELDLNVTKTYELNGGVNLKDQPTKIADNQSPDMTNFISDDGSTYVRNGTRRFNTTALSTNPITSMYKGYSSSGKSIFIVTSADKIYVSSFSTGIDENTYFDNASTGDVTTTQPAIDFINSSGTIFVSTWALNGVPNRLQKPNQKFSFETINDEIFMVSESTVPLRYNIDAGSISFVPGNPPKANFILQRGDYTLMARTTDAMNRVMWSDVGNPYSWNVLSYRDLESGEKITGMANAQDGIKIFTDRSIWNLSFTILSYQADGNQTFTKQYDGVGCIAPYSIANFGDGIFFLARDGFRILLGGQNVLIDDAINKKVTSKLIQSGRYVSVVAHFDRKNKWIWVAYEDDKAYPKGVNNKVIVYDLRLGQWYPIQGMSAASFCSWDKDNLELFYGDSIDSYVNEMDVESRNVDARKELSIINFDSELVYSGGCTGGNIYKISRDSSSHIEGDRAIRFNYPGSGPALVANCNNSVLVNNISQYPDKTDVSSNDYFQFKFSTERHAANDSINITLVFNDDVLFPSYSYTYQATAQELLGDNKDLSPFAWHTVKIRISSFPATIGTEPSISQSMNRTLKAIFFDPSTSFGNSILRLDDIRIVQSEPNRIKAYRYTKPFDLGIKNAKTWNRVLVTMQTNPEAQLKIDILENFGRQTIARELNGGYSDFIYISSGQVLRKLKKVDYVIDKDSLTLPGYEINILQPTEDYLYGLNKSTGILFKMELTSMTIEDSISSFASGSTFRNSVGLAVDDKSIFVLQKYGNRVLEFDKNLVFISSYSLEVSSPTGIATDGSNYYVIDSGSKTISRYDSKFKLKKRVLFSDISFNDEFRSVISVNQNYVLTSYRRPPDSPLFSFSTATVVQLRDKFDLNIIKEIEIKNGKSGTIPLNIQTDNEFFYLAISSPAYLQKYYIDSLDFVSGTEMGDLDGMGTNNYYVDSSFREIPIGTSSRYLQLLYRVDHPFDRIRLFDQTFIATKQELR